MAEKKINVTKLDRELREADIPIDGCNSSGRIDFKKEVTKEQTELAQKILSAHVPYDYIEERAKAYPCIQEQLDMLYWDKVNGTNIWQEKITEIKAKYPKEEPIEEIEELEE